MIHCEYAELWKKKRVQGSNVMPVSKTEFGMTIGTTFTLSYPVLTMCNVHSLVFILTSHVLSLIIWN